jgi:ABC-type sugar transport system ATPase subunit
MMEVRLEDVRVERGGRLVLDVPALSIASGRVTALLGPNGAGKTTLLRTIIALERPVSGTVSIGGRVSSPDRETRELVAYAFQSAVFLSGSVARNLDLALRLRRVPREERDRRIRETAGALGVGHLLPRDASKISGGEAQRVNLARALSLRAPALLLDEPLAGLDEPSRESLIGELRGLLTVSGATVVLVTHDREEAARLADHVVVLVGGRVHASGPVSEVYGRPPDADTARFLGWTLVERDATVEGIAPGALRTGQGECCFPLDVERAAKVGSRWELTGRIGATLARATSETEHQPGERVSVWAAFDDVVDFPGGSP